MNLEDVEVNFRLSVIKPLHAQWLVNLYNFFSTERGRQVICKGWKKAGILGLLDGTTVLPPEDPFEYTLFIMPIDLSLITLLKKNFF